MLKTTERLRTKISARHLERAAYVYVRQSTQKQVKDNHGSRGNQYALLERAVELGWHEERVRVVDDDQGLSAKNAGGREGFKELVGEVSLGYAGIVLATRPVAWRATTRTGTRCWTWQPYGEPSSPTPTASTTPPTTTTGFC